MRPISWYKSLSEPKDRSEAGCFLVEGERGASQLLAYHREHVLELLCVDGAAETLNASGIPVRTVSPANMKSICTSRTPQGIAAVVRMPADVYTSILPAPPLPSNCRKSADTLIHPRKSAPEPSKSKKKVDTQIHPYITTKSPGYRVLLLEDVQDPGNAGTLIRTAAAFGYDGIIMSGKCADPFSPKVVRSTAGSLLSLWIRRSGAYIDMAAELKSRGCELIAADLGGEEARGLSSAGAHVLMLGNEGAGLGAAALDICGRRIRIPIAASGAESLNVAVSGGIIMFMINGGAV